MSIAKAGRRIASLADWEQYAPPKSPHHWVDGRSAKEVARAWLEGGRTTMPHEVLAVLAGHPRFNDVLSWDVEPEAKLRFDTFPGTSEHRPPRHRKRCAWSLSARDRSEGRRDLRPHSRRRARRRFGAAHPESQVQRHRQDRRVGDAAPEATEWRSTQGQGSAIPVVHGLCRCAGRGTSTPVGASNHARARVHHVRDIRRETRAKRIRSPNVLVSTDGSRRQACPRRGAARPFRICTLCGGRVVRGQGHAKFQMTAISPDSQSRSKIWIRRIRLIRLWLTALRFDKTSSGNDLLG